MPEWSNGAVSKTVVRLGAPGVRIPLSPLISDRLAILPDIIHKVLTNYDLSWE